MIFFLFIFVITIVLQPLPAKPTPKFVSQISKDDWAVNELKQECEKYHAGKKLIMNLKPGHYDQGEYHYDVQIDESRLWYSKRQLRPQEKTHPIKTVKIKALKDGSFMPELRIRNLHLDLTNGDLGDSDFDGLIFNFFPHAGGKVEWVTLTGPPPGSRMTYVTRQISEGELQPDESMKVVKRFQDPDQYRDHTGIVPASLSNCSKRD